MCGIAGFVTHKFNSSNDAINCLQLMGQAIKSRGPDDCGTWFDHNTGVGFTHQRLAIQDLSAHGAQPMQSVCGRYIIVFNGEVYNFPELSKSLNTLGYSFRGHSDTEVMLTAISHWGLKTALSKFVGMFAFALWDVKQRELHLVRDRLGIKPLYYGWNNGFFVFCSELKALKVIANISLKLNQNVLASFLRYAYIANVWGSRVL